MVSRKETRAPSVDRRRARGGKTAKPSVVWDEDRLEDDDDESELTNASPSAGTATRPTVHFLWGAVTGGVVCFVIGLNVGGAEEASTAVASTSSPAVTRTPEPVTPTPVTLRDAAPPPPDFPKSVGGIEFGSDKEAARVACNARCYEDWCTCRFLPVAVPHVRKLEFKLTGGRVGSIHLSAEPGEMQELAEMVTVHRLSAFVKGDPSLDTYQLAGGRLHLVKNKKPRVVYVPGWVSDEVAKNF